MRMSAMHEAANHISADQCISGFFAKSLTMAILTPVHIPPPAWIELKNTTHYRPLNDAPSEARAITEMINGIQMDLVIFLIRQAKKNWIGVDIMTCAIR